MSGIVYYIVDVESNGILNHHEITEVSIIRCSDKMQMTEMVKCDNPELSSLDALRITNKTPEDLLKGLSKAETIAKINKFLLEDGLEPKNRCFIGHNVQFDRRFLHRMYDKEGSALPVDNWLCTMAMTRKYAKQIGMNKPSVALDNACKIVGIKKFAGAHASKVDTRNTYLLWKSLLEDKKLDYLEFLKCIPQIVNEDCYLDPEFE